MLKKPQKLAKARGKTKERPPSDQHPMDTECGFCHKHFPDPTTARIHMDEDHPGAYAD